MKNLLKFNLIGDTIHEIKRFFENIKNIFHWLPVIWKDRDWDDWYIYEVLRFKLERTSKYLKKNNLFVGVERECQYIDTCVRLIKKLQDEYYTIEYFDYYDVDMKWHDSDRPKCKTLSFETTRDNLDEYFKKYKLTYNKVLIDDLTNQIQRDKNENRSITAMQMGNYRHKKAKNLLFKILNNRIDYWWD